LDSFVAFFEDLDLDDAARVGGKGANLARLTSLGLPVPRGFSVNADAYYLFMSSNRLEPRILEGLGSLRFEDPAAVDEGAARIRKIIESAAIPAAVESQLRSAYRSLVAGQGPGALVAVRSSVGTRDMSVSSFPGQMDTYHNIAGEDDVVDAVRRCWASAFSYKAVVSRQARGIDQVGVFVAPVVQLMVPSEKAGVLFTANPLNGRTDQMVINACFGLGEGVVSGEVSADHYVVDKRSFEVLTSEIGDKSLRYVLDSGSGAGTVIVPVEGEEALSRCLTGAEIAELGAVALGIERSYGRPQDIEWAYAGGSLSILQARPVTSLGERRPGAVEAENRPGEWVSEFDSTVDPRYPCYTLSNISEVLPGVLSPLTVSGIDHLDYGFVKTNTDFGLMKGIHPDSRYTFLGIFYGRAHLNLSVVKTLTSRLPGASAQEFERMVPEDEGWEDERFRPTPRALLALPPVLARVLNRMVRTQREAADMRRRLEQMIAEEAARDFEKIEYAELAAGMEESKDYRSRIIALHITASQFAVVSHDMLRKLTAAWLGDEHGTLASRLVTGLQNIESAEPVLEIWDLSRLVVSRPALVRLFDEAEPGDIVESLEDMPGPGAAEFRRALADFLGRYGYRSVFEAELMLPSWEDDPSFVMSMIQNYLRSGPDVDPRAQVDRQRADRDLALEEARAELRGPRRWAFEVLLGQVQKYIALREFTKATLIIGIARLKKVFHELGRRFAAEGKIADPEDLFFLSMEEVESLARGESTHLPTGERIARRRLEYERNKTVVLPAYSRGRPKPLTGARLETEGGAEVLTGIPVSRGVVTGTARVITDPRKRARIEPGEILVAQVTDAAWTPLFVTASAIVVDVGGPLSHGSIVAREFGIPGVLNVGMATRLIKDGQTITVDGDEGKVYLHGGGLPTDLGPCEPGGEPMPDTAARSAPRAAGAAKVATLSALYSAYKKAKKVGVPLDEDAERLHPHSGDRDWNESYYFNFMDRSTGMGGYTRIGILPNQESDVGAMMLFAGGRRLLVAVEGGRVQADAGGLRIGGIRLERVEPLRRWRLIFEGEMLDIPYSRKMSAASAATAGTTRVDLDVTFEGLAPCFDFKDSDPRALAEMIISARTRMRDLGRVSRVSGEHYEQAGKCSGAIAVGGVENVLSGSGHRDHSWGIRDWSAPRLWTWLTAQFDGGPAFNLSRVAIESVDIFNGFICRDGKNFPVRRATLETRFEDDGVTQRSLKLTMEDTGGKVIEVVGRVLTVIPLDLRARGHSTLVNEGLAEYSCEGRTAFGIAEYLHQMG